MQARSRDAQRSAKVTVLAEFLEKYYEKNGEYPKCEAITNPNPQIVVDTTLNGMSTDALLMPGNGTNTSGFSGLPGGYRYFDGTFYDIGDSGYWWSSSESFTYSAWSRYLSYNVGNVNRSYNDKTNGFSVRCIKD